MARAKVAAQSGARREGAKTVVFEGMTRLLGGVLRTACAVLSSAYTEAGISPIDRG
jgi:hypothetical protein